MSKSALPQALVSALQAIYVVAQIPRCTAADFQSTTGMSVMTFRRSIRVAERVYGIKIRYIRNEKTEAGSLSVGNSGHYVIDDWGFVQRRKFLEHVRQLMAEAEAK